MDTMSGEAAPAVPDAAKTSLPTGEATQAASDGAKNLPDRTASEPGQAASDGTKSKQKKPKTPKPPKPAKDQTKAKDSSKSKPKQENAAKPLPTDPDAMFKVGFLADVYNERPAEKVVTRFPPEPNGYLHIGHSKAIAVNFGFARYHNGECYLRLDDTNPEEEEKEFEESIIDTIRWLGFKPKAVTYSSDNFDRLYELAEALIWQGKAYVCHCTRDQINDQRGGTDPKKKKPRYACPHRDRPTEESLSEFRAMREAKYRPNEASLRMKQDLEDPNPQMWDLIAYRIPKRAESETDGKDEAVEGKEVAYAKPHYRTGDKWKIYPSYDFCHCLCDSFEGVTHSLCTVEFELSRRSYEWLNDQLVDFKPMQREYGRLSVTGTITSKRKIKKLITKGHVSGYDDPRLYTLMALRRRGIPPGAILSFINELGVTKAMSVIQTKRLEASVRRYLETTVPRLMLVIDPIKVIIDNLPDDHVELVELPFAKDPSVGSHSVPFTKVVYIERSDFREVDSPDYFRLAPGKTVGLMKAPFPITATIIDKDPTTGDILAVHANYEKPEDGSPPKKPKSWIHWVGVSPAHNSPIHATVRYINPLFKSDNPAVQPDIEADINPDSQAFYHNAMLETGFEEIQRRAPWLAEAGEQTPTAAADGAKADDQGTAELVSGTTKPRPETVRFQGMRMGYFCVDIDMDRTVALNEGKGQIILNRIVTLKEDSGKD